MSNKNRSYDEVTHIRVPQNEDDVIDIPPPPDGGYGWVIVLASFLCNMVVDGISYTFGIFLPEIVKDYGETKGNVAWVGSILTGATMCAGPIVSALANKFGCRAVCMAGSLISTVAFALSIFSPNVIWLMLTYGLIGGIGFGLIYLPAVVCVGYYFESKRSLATGVAVCGSGVGTFAFAPLATILLQSFGWKGANLILAGIIFNCIIFGALMRPLEYPKKSKLSDNLARNVSAVRLDSSKNFQGPVKSSSHGTIPTVVRNRNDSVGSVTGRNIVEVESAAFMSKLSLASRKSNVIQPLARKDVFYSGSILNLKEYQSQKSLASYRQSVTNLQNLSGRDQTDGNPYVGLLKDPVFMLIGISNLFGMAALYVPFVYLVDCATASGIDASSASFLLSIIGITNTIGRIVCGYFADFPEVNALLVNNICLCLAAVSVGFIPFCHTYTAYATVSVVFAIAVSGYISLSSIILVDLLGLDKLTNAFGLLILFRGAAALVGSPMAGALYDATLSYDIPFYVAAALFAVSAAISFLVPCVNICSPKGNSENLENEILNPANKALKDFIGPLVGALCNKFGCRAVCVAGSIISTVAFAISIFSPTVNWLMFTYGFLGGFGFGLIYLPAVVSVGYYFESKRSLATGIAVCGSGVGTFAFAPMATFLLETYGWKGANLVLAGVIFNCAVFGALMRPLEYPVLAGFISLSSIILVDLLGLDKLTNAFGLLTFFRGTAALIGTPLAGVLYDVTKTYDLPFYVASSLFALAAVTSSIAPYLKQTSNEIVRDTDEALKPINEENV